MTIDELIPCFAKGEPAFSQSIEKDLWVPLLEKAYAKLFGGYHQLRGGYVSEALMDLTGCPTVKYRLEDEHVRKFIIEGHFWNLMEYFRSEGYPIVFESEPV